jgi:hypothetical protein
MAVLLCRYETPGIVMFQIIGSLLALATVIATLAAAPVYGLVFALATIGWVIKAKPAQAAEIEDDAPQGSIIILDQFR